MSEQKVALITGATSGIGRAAAKTFAANGFQVVAVGRNSDNLKSLKDDVSSEPRIYGHLADLTKADQVDALFSTLADEFGTLDVLVNAAGIIKNGSIIDTTEDDWDAMMNINLRSVFSLMKKSVPFLQKSKGNIVNVSSVTGLRAFPNVLAYCVSKAAIDQLTRCAALELAPHKIRVNAVNPGVVETNLHRRGGMEVEAYASFLQRAGETHPIGRHGTPDEVAELIYYLASDKAGWITGVTYEIDGGRAQTCAR